MKQVLNHLKKAEAERRISVLRLEIDYELATLYDAMTEKDTKLKAECKRKLEKLRLEMNRLEV
ncbi:hypothetical protein JOC85_000287 [Bacillus mesophilus]|uniref:Uncharacterized protein n=1 Tax=Bacillus mesophilus TaxID=1808955 RepID=A0A6M0Q2Q1_9BACI|nr:hypothetical protein [Bacillus mesophilus]MBM7659520.1 hypothetical protein [Bacillus mesophilus]NEY70393.1 hypothetical protein [Bacillus mesophilus]